MFSNIDNQNEDRDPLGNSGSGEFVSTNSLAEMIANLTNTVATIQKSNQDINENIETMSQMYKGFKDCIENRKSSHRI